MSPKKTTLGLAILLAAAWFAFSGAVSALAKDGSGIVRAPAENLEVEILDSNSDLVNYIYLISPGPEIFIGVDDAIGTVVTLPPVALHAELIFEIRVFEPDGVTDTGLRWFTGPPSRNEDHKFHAILGMPGPDQIQVNFEDIHGDGWGVANEPNYVDAIFVVRPVP